MRANNINVKEGEEEEKVQAAVKVFKESLGPWKQGQVQKARATLHREIFVFYTNISVFFVN